MVRTGLALLLINAFVLINFNKIYIHKLIFFYTFTLFSLLKARDRERERETERDRERQRETERDREKQIGTGDRDRNRE